MPMNNRLLRPRQTTHPEAAAWKSAVVANGGTVSGTTFSAVDKFCKAIASAGIRDRFYRLNLFCGTGLNACLVPLYRGPSLGGTQYGNTTDTNVGPFVSGDYVETGASGGLKPNGSTKYLDTGFLANALTQSGRHLSVYTDMATSALNRFWFGVDNVGCGSNAYWAIGSSSTSQAQVRSGIPGAVSFSATGKSHVLLTGNGNATAYVNGVSAATVTGTAFTAPSQAVYIGALNRCNAAADFGSSRFAAYSIGDSMTDAQAAAYYTAMQAFQTALGRNA